MRKVVSTEMCSTSVDVSVSIYSEDGGSPVDKCHYVFPFELVNPRVSLQIATLLVSDPSIPQTDDKETK